MLPNFSSFQMYFLQKLLCSVARVSSPTRGASVKCGSLQFSQNFLSMNEAFSIFSFLSSKVFNLSIGTPSYHNGTLSPASTAVEDSATQELLEHASS